MSVTETSIDNSMSLAQSKELFRTQAATNRGQSTVDAYCIGVDSFIKWAETEAKGISGVSDLTPLSVGGYRVWIAKQGYAKPTVSHYINGVRQWLQFLEKRQAIQQGTHEVIETYTVPPKEKKWDKKISAERVDRILAYMERRYPQHRDTIILKILAKTGMRVSGLRAIDVSDVCLDSHERPEIRLRDRPETGTPLKRGKDKLSNHERNVPIRMDLYEDIKTYIKEHRHDVYARCRGERCSNEHGDCAGDCDTSDREPLITSRYGRLSRGCIQEAVYKWTCPKHTTVGECSCEEKPNSNKASQCEKSVSPHALRGAAVTRFRTRGHGWEDIGELVGCEPDTLKVHYDNAGFEEKADRARKVIS